MGPAYHKGVPWLGVPENPTDFAVWTSPKFQTKNAADVIRRFFPRMWVVNVEIFVLNVFEWTVYDLRQVGWWRIKGPWAFGRLDVLWMNSWNFLDTHFQTPIPQIMALNQTNPEDVWSIWEI